MKKIFLILFALLRHIGGYAQTSDAQWVIGPNTSVLDFRIDTVGLDAISTFMNTKDANADICDSNGNLLYYTNGFYIAGSNGNVLLNGDTLSPCSYTDEQYPNGLNIPQAAIFLPKPGSSRYYYLFHFSNDTENNERPATIYYSLIDQEANSSLGAVINKNVPILKDVILREGGMTACKHGNGRDYWIVMPGYHNNEFYKFLLTPDTILGPFIQNIGPTFPGPSDVAYSKFSQDGSKYVTSCFVGPVLVMDFDRCSGEFSNPITIFHYAGTVSGQAVSGAASEEFSPNGRFLYVNNITDLTQYDLLADTIQDSVELYVSDSSDFYGLHMLQLAPNGKLYTSTWNGGLYALHVINYPNLKGDSCNFVYGGQPTLSANSFNLPNMINYTLGALANSVCDTIPTNIEQQPTDNIEVNLYPNPANQQVYLSFYAQTTGEVTFEIMDQLGNIVIDAKLGNGQTFASYSISNLSNAIYYWRLEDSQRTIKVGKLAVMK